MNRKNHKYREPEITYELIESQESEAHLDRAFNILFDEVLRRRVERLRPIENRDFATDLDGFTDSGVELGREI